MPWTELKPIGIDTMSIPKKFSGGRQIWNRLLGNYYAWADLKSIWYGGEACELTFSAT